MCEVCRCVRCGGGVVMLVAYAHVQSFSPLVVVVIVDIDIAIAIAIAMAMACKCNINYRHQTKSRRLGDRSVYLLADISPQMRAIIV